MARDSSPYSRRRGRLASDSPSSSPRKNVSRPELSSSTRHRQSPNDYRRNHDDRSHRKRHLSTNSRSRSPDRRGRKRHGDSYDDSCQGRERRELKKPHRQDSADRDEKRYNIESTPQSKRPLPSQADAFDNETAIAKKSPPLEKQKPNYGNTGKLAAESNTITSAEGQAIVLKYHEPPEARKPSPKDAWRLYVFKESELVDTIELAQRSCWLFGREHAVVDFPVDHPSCSKQHAVIQFRYVEKSNEYGDKTGKVRPYIIDLESANRTEVNGDMIPAGRYVELRDKDMVKFGLSSREYVLMLPPSG